MKRVVAVLCLLGLLYAPAEAKVNVFKDFSLDIPAGYKTEERAAGRGYAVVVTAPSGAQVTYRYEPRGRLSFEAWVRDFARREKPRSITTETDGEGEDYYVLDFVRNGVPGETLIYDINDRVLTIAYTGKDDKLDEMWESFLWK